MSRWHDQTSFHSETTLGNCVQASVASILLLPLEEVPAFDQPGGPSQLMALDAWLRRRGIEVQRRFTERGSVPFGEGLYLATGTTVRGTMHMVVYQDGKLFHDPHPSRAGLLEVRYISLLVPIDPSTVAVRRRPHVGDPVVFVRLAHDGTRRQFPAFVTDAKLEFTSDDLRPAISLAWINMDTPFIPPTWWGRMLSRLGYNFGYGPALEQRTQVQHRDNWGQSQGGDDFGEHWCWPDESTRAQTYLD